jgi:hypothetical protein
VYKLTADDLLSNTMFDDAVAMAGYPIDIHPVDGKEAACRELKKGSWYSFPYRGMVTAEIKNLIVSGRCVSVTHEALGAIRVTPMVMALGQAAGTAAALARKDGDVKNINIKTLRETLIKDGAFLKPWKG